MGKEGQEQKKMGKERQNGKKAFVNKKGNKDWRDGRESGKNKNWGSSCTGTSHMMNVIITYIETIQINLIIKEYTLEYYSII